jgi:hypothetical protein
MAVSVRIEDEAFSDRRYDVLASLLGLPDADCARGKMAAVWRQCTQQQTHILTAEMVCIILGPNGPDALLKSELGAPVEGGIRICGTRGRIEWLARLRKNGQKGGRPRKPNGNHLVIQNSANGKPGVNPPAPAPAPVNKKKGRASTPRPDKPEPHPDRARVIDAFHRRFKAAYGTKPTWDGKTVSQVETLLKKHTGDVLIARIDFMFDGRAKWPPGPYSLDVFVVNIDRWVEASQQSFLQPPIRKEQEL